MGLKICVVGGGGSVAVALRIISERMPEAIIDVFTKRKVAGYRPCELTYVLGKQIPDFETIVTFDAKAMEAQNIKYHFETEVTEINRGEKYILSSTGRYNYDKLILATGASPFLPDIPGIKGSGVYVLGTDMQFAIELQKVISGSKSALIMGAGAIGLELAEVLVKESYERVVVVEAADRPLGRAMDPEMAKAVTEKMTQQGIEFYFSTKVIGIEAAGKRKKVLLAEQAIVVDFVVAATGFRPNVELAKKCGLEIGSTGGIKVSSHMMTSDPDIYAIGDTVEGWDTVGNRAVLAMKADNAVRTGKVAAKHLTGDLNLTFNGTVGGFIIQLADTFFGAVGCTEEIAKTIFKSNIKSVWHDGMTLPKYLGGHPVKIKLVFDSAKQLLLGAQMISKSNIAAELDRLGLAISEKIVLEKLAVSETVYTPASGWPYSPVAQAIDKCL